MAAPRAPGPPSRLEWAAVALLLLAALLPRARDLFGPFDRHFEGYQGAFFTLCAINYERLGFDALAGYPALNIDAEPDADPHTLYAYPNHPPLVPWLAWAAASVAGPEGWDTAWQEHRAPEELEAAVRLPFLLLGMLGVLGLWWAARQARGRLEGALALALFAALPISAAYGTLVNYELPSLAGIVLAYGFHARYLRTGARSALLGVGLCFAAAGAATYAPVFFVPPLVLQALLHRRLRAAVAVGAASSLGVLAPLGLHAVLVRRALERIGSPETSLGDRVLTLVGPLFDGSLPLARWLGLQGERLLDLVGWPLLLAALAGLGLSARALLARRAAADPPAPGVGPPLLLGGVLLLLGYYRHTFDDQDPFLLNLGPGLAACAAVPFAALAPTLARLRGGLAPLVVAVSLVVMPAVARTNELRRRWRAPGPAEGVPATEPYAGPAQPLPSTVGPELAAVLPPGSAGLVPDVLGYNLAVSYYAWRTLVPVSRRATGPTSYEHAVALLEATGLGDAPRYLLLPVHPPPEHAELLEGVRAEFAAVGAPALETAEWQAWALP